MTNFILDPELQRIRRTLAALSSREGWLAWDGGICPVGLNDEVGIMFRNRHFRAQSCTARHVDWKHWKSDGDIVAYRLISAEQVGK